MFFMLEAFYYFSRRKEQRFYRNVSYTMFFWALLLLKDPLYVYFEQNAFLYGLMMLIDMSVLLTCAFYLIELLSPQHIDAKRALVHAAPYLAVVCLYAIMQSDLAFNIAIGVMSVYSTIIFCSLFHLARTYQKTVGNNYSDTAPANVEWLWKATALFILLLGGWIFICYFNSPISDFFYYTSILAIWGLVSYHTRRQDKLLNEVRMILREHRMQEKPEKQQTVDFSKDVDELFRIRKIHQDPHLTMTKVVTMIGTNRNYFSSYLNCSLQVNFFEFINGFRLCDAERLILDPSCNLSQEAIAQTVGFNSLSTFRRAFIKKHGVTPNQFRKQQAATSGSGQASESHDCRKP